MKIKFHARLAIGILAILAGILVNKYSVQHFFGVTDIPDIIHFMNILALQLFLILMGIYFIVKKRIFKSLSIFVFGVLVAFVIVNGKVILERIISQETQIPLLSKLQSKISPENLAAQADFYDKSEIAQLSFETGEILPSLHQSSIRMKFQIPKNGILDTAVGIDPLIKSLFSGQVGFEITLDQGKDSPQILFRKYYDIKDMNKKDFVWDKISLDISEMSGKEVSLDFKKTFKMDSSEELDIIYDLLPTDFMFWRKPQIRSKNLSNKRNVILISLDAVRADHLHFMGYDRETSPNMDEMAWSGTSFTTVVTQAPWTIPSHFSLFTSTYPSVHKNNQPIQEEYRYWDNSLPTISSILREKGYVTGAFTGRGSISAKFGFYEGFDFYNETNTDKFKGADAEIVFDKTLEWLEENKDRTFFLFIHTYEAHYPYESDFFVKKEGISKSDKMEHRIARYDSGIRQADQYLGKLRRKLDELGLTERTLLIVSSDHGEDLGGRNPPDSILQYGHGYSLYDELLLVPLIFFNPAIIPKGNRIEPQIRLIDVAPTIIDYLGYDQEPSFQGTSLKPMIEDLDRESRPAYSEATTYGTERESMRFNGYKYIHRLSYGQLFHPTSKGLSLTPIHELYDLNNDPHERKNLAEEREDMIKEYQQLIHNINPIRKFSPNDKNINNLIDLKKDKKLLETLKSLGYIK